MHFTHLYHCLLVILSAEICKTTNTPSTGPPPNSIIQEFKQVKNIKLMFSQGGFPGSITITKFELMEYMDNKSVSIRIANGHIRGYNPGCVITGVFYSPNITELLNITASPGDVLYFKLDNSHATSPSTVTVFEHGKTGAGTAARVVKSIATEQLYMELPVEVGYNGPFYSGRYGDAEYKPIATRYTVLYLSKRK